jgi:hypothetical protein
MKQKPAFTVKCSQSTEYTVKSIYNKWNLFNTETEELNPDKNKVKHFNGREYTNERKNWECVIFNNSAAYLSSKNF